MSVIPTTPGLQTTFENNNEDLLNLLADDWQDPVKDKVTSSKWTRDYLTRLTSLSLKELIQEPQQLREEHSKSTREAQQLAFREYPSFLHAQTCRRQVEETMEGLDVHLGEFSSSIDELPTAFKEFEEATKIIREERNKITSVLKHQSVLTDLLEIPQLMETCVRNGYYSEAMDLASHVRLLQVRYPLSVIRNIQQQVQASSDLMLVQLVSHLRKPIRLAAAMNVVGFLRRMDVFESETELRMVFLRCRHDYLQQRLQRAKRDISEEARQKSSDAFEYLKRFIDVMREQTFEISTQYISIFSNEQSTLLSDYMVHVMGLIKTALSTYLPMIEDTSALASLLTQLQYCGMSLGRVGLDFRHVFVHAFEDALQPMLLAWMNASTETLVQFMSTALDDGAAPSTWMASKTASHTTDTAAPSRNAFQPPMLLVAYPSLAVFTNGILSTLNALRLLPAIRLFAPIQTHLDACFLEIAAVLKQYCDQAASRLPDEITYLQSYTAAYVRCCLPYLKSCLVDGIYGQLSEPSALDQDVELMLVNYLPVIEHNGSDVGEKDNAVDEEPQQQQDPIVDTQESNKVETSVNMDTEEVVEDVQEVENNIKEEKADDKEIHEAVDNGVGENDEEKKEILDQPKDLVPEAKSSTEKEEETGDKEIQDVVDTQGNGAGENDEEKREILEQPEDLEREAESSTKDDKEIHDVVDTQENGAGEDYKEKRVILEQPKDLVEDSNEVVHEVESSVKKEWADEKEPHDFVDTQVNGEQPKELVEDTNENVHEAENSVKEEEGNEKELLKQPDNLVDSNVDVQKKDEEAKDSKEMETNGKPDSALKQEEHPKPQDDSNTAVTKSETTVKKPQKKKKNHKRKK